MTSRTRLVVLALTLSVTWALAGAASALACPRDPAPVPAVPAWPNIYGSNVALFPDRVEITTCVERLISSDSDMLRPPQIKLTVTITIWGKVTRRLSPGSSTTKFDKLGSFKSSAENGENVYVVPTKLRAKIERRNRIRVKMTLRDPDGKKVDTAREDATVPH